MVYHANSRHVYPESSVSSIHLPIEIAFFGPGTHGPMDAPRPGLPEVNRSVLSYVPSGAQDGQPLPVVAGSSGGLGGVGNSRGDTGNTFSDFNHLHV